MSCPFNTMPVVRQVAEKFLERDELASMSFQNDFLTPFVVVMRQSAAKEIRELIIRQASRMVLSRVTNIKSGWKSMFMVRGPFGIHEYQASSKSFAESLKAPIACTAWIKTQPSATVLDLIVRCPRTPTVTE